MSTMTPADMARTMSAGLLSFPVTHFKDDLSFDEPRYREHCDWLLKHGMTGLFAAGGTGEFFALTPSEVATVCRAAVQETRGRVPVIAGCGYGTAIAIEMAQAAEKAGANGILLLPPYLMTPSQAGLAAHIRAVCRATSIGVIVYNRDNSIADENTLAELCEQCPNLVGYKDGVGDVELMMRVYSRLGDRLVHRWTPHGRDVRHAVPGDGRDHVFLGDIQLPAGLGPLLLSRRACARSRNGAP